MKPMNYSLYRESTLGTARAIELRLEIDAFHADYCAALDAGMVEDWPGFFTDDALYRITARENAERNLPVGLVYAEGIGMMRDRVVSLRHANVYAKQYYRHLVTDVRILERSAHVLRASSNYLVTRTVASEGDPIVFSVGRTDDLIELGPEGLLFRRRRVVADNDRIHTLLVLPI